MPTQTIKPTISLVFSVYNVPVPDQHSETAQAGELVLNLIGGREQVEPGKYW